MSAIHSLCRRARKPRPQLLASVFATLIWSGLPTPGVAEVQIRGAVDALEIEARRSSVGEVLQTLEADLNLRFRGASNLRQPFAGIIRGPLWEVLPRLLGGYDYVAKVSEGGGLEIVYAAQSPAVRRSTILSNSSTPKPAQARPPAWSRKVHSKTSSVRSSQRKSGFVRAKSLAAPHFERCRLNPSACGS
jgi:hypothetical protein